MISSKPLYYKYENDEYPFLKLTVKHKFYTIFVVSESLIFLIKKGNSLFELK